MKYTFSEEEDDIYSDSTSARRSTRNTGTHTPAEPSGPTITQSGRQVKSRHVGAYGESMLSGSTAGFANGFDDGSDDPSVDENPGGRPPRRAAATNGHASTAKSGRHIQGYNDVDEMSSDEDDASEQDYGDDEEEDVPLESDVDDQDDLPDQDEDEEMLDAPPKKLIVKLSIKTPTPEKKTTIKLRLSPEKERDASTALFPATTNGTTASATAPEAPLASSVPASVEVKENVQPELVDNPQKSIHSIPAQPPSPLAIRSSPEKPAVY